MSGNGNPNVQIGLGLDVRLGYLSSMESSDRVNISSRFFFFKVAGKKATTY